MSENIEDLLNEDEDNEGDYDLGDDEEDALLDDNFEPSSGNKQQPSMSTKIEEEAEPETDFLDLDDATELNDDEEAEASLLNATIDDDDETSRKTDKFASERKDAKAENFQKSQQQQGGKNFAVVARQNQRNFQFHGRGRGFQHNKKKVLINPHFRGNVQIKNNVALAWDKKPCIYIQPWLQQNRPQPVVNNYLQPQPQFNAYNAYQPQVNQKPPVHQRLGINPNLCDPYIQFPQPSQTFQQQMPQQQQNPPIYNIQPQQLLPIYNQPPPTFSNQQPMYMDNYNVYPTQNNAPIFIPPPPQQQQPPSAIGNEYNIFNQEITPFDRRIVTTPCAANYQRQFSPPKRKFDHIKGDLKKKKRNLPSNLHEVQTVDIITVNKEEEEDEEMKAYRLKIEQQKLIREKILHQKEERRKQAAKKLQVEEEYKTVVPPNDLLKDLEIPVITNIKLQPKIVVKTYNSKTALHANNPNIVPIKTVNVFNNEISVKRVVSNMGRVVVANKKSNDVSAAVGASTAPPSELNSFLSNRKILAKDQSLVDTPVVVVSNLATGTSVAKLRKLCQAVGDIQNLRMSGQERQATIQFKSVASAHAFYKKYQRFMLDLSMIQVNLKPLL